MTLLTNNPPKTVGIAIQETDYFITGDNPLITNEACLEFPVLDIGKDSLRMTTEGGCGFGDGEEVLIGQACPSSLLIRLSCSDSVSLMCLISALSARQYCRRHLAEQKTCQSLVGIKVLGQFLHFMASLGVSFGFVIVHASKMLIMRLYISQESSRVPFPSRYFLILYRVLGCGRRVSPFNILAMVTWVSPKSFATFSRVRSCS